MDSLCIKGVHYLTQGELQMSNLHHPFVSVIIPTYNREGIILESVKSVLEQTYENFELIIVDDCSKDNTIKALEGICDARLKIIKQDTNSGACAARNRGIRESRGKIIAFQDSDDLWDSTKLEKQIKSLLDNKADIVFCQGVRIMGEKEELLPKQEKSGFVEKRTLQTRSLVSTQMLLGYSYCFRENMFDENMPRYQDYDLVIRLAEKYRFYYLAEPLVTIRVQSDSITNDSMKLVRARKLLLEKYPAIIDGNQEMKADMLKSLLHNEALNGISDYHTAIELFKTNKSVKNGIIVFLSRFGLYKRFAK